MVRASRGAGWWGSCVILLKRVIDEIKASCPVRKLGDLRERFVIDSRNTRPLCCSGFSAIFPSGSSKCELFLIPFGGARTGPPRPDIRTSRLPILVSVGFENPESPPPYALCVRRTDSAPASPALRKCLFNSRAYPFQMLFSALVWSRESEASRRFGE